MAARFFAIATEFRMWPEKHHQSETALLVPSYESAFKMNMLAWEFFNSQASSYKKVMIHWIMNANKRKLGYHDWSKP